MKLHELHTLKINSFFLLTGFALLFIISCSKDEPDPLNPYSSIDYGTGNNGNPDPDPNTIQGLHKNIFSVRCANPSCHDGSFEPDYRTVQSTYSTLIYQPVNKNTQSGDFKYRVIPYDTAKSWLHYRLLTQDSVLGRMPLYSTPLTDKEMGWVKTWIMQGAKDINGNVPVLPAMPNQPPKIEGYNAYNSNNVRIDTMRVGGLPFNPFIAPKNDNIKIFFRISDDSTAVKDLQINIVKASLNIDNFSAAKSYNAAYAQIGNLKYWWVDIPTSDFNPGETVYLRYYVGDGNPFNNIEFPTNTTFRYFKTSYAFYIAP
jgi:hypothetical protein